MVSPDSPKGWRRRNARGAQPNGALHLIYPHSGDDRGPAPVDPHLQWLDERSYAGAGVMAQSLSVLCCVRVSDFEALVQAMALAIRSTLASVPKLPTSLADKDELAALVAKARNAGFVVPAHYLTADRLAARPIFFTAHIPKAAFVTMADELRDRWRAVISGPFRPPAPREDAGTFNGPLVGASSRLVIAVIDDGCPLANMLYRRADGSSRIRYLWDQGFGAELPWRTPSGEWYGRELTNVEIDSVLSTTTFDNGTTNDRAVYVNLRYPGKEPQGGADPHTPPSLHRPMPGITHGGAVLALAAGAPDPRGTSLPASANPDPVAAADIIFVQLPPSVVRDTEGGGKFQCAVMDALAYIAERTDEQALLLVNLSYGAAAGPHDGTTVLEQYFETDFLNDSKPNRALFLPAGNLLEERMHAVVELREKNHQQALTWEIPSHNRKQSELQLWWSSTSSDTSIEVRLTAPGGVPSAWVRIGESMFWTPGDRPVASIVFAPSSPLSASGPVIVFFVAPTTGQDSAMPGDWTVDIRDVSETPDVTVNAWIQRSDPTFGGEGLQSRFSLDECAVSKESTMAETSNGTKPVVCGAYVLNSDAATPTERMSSYASSESSQPRGLRTGPDVSAPADASPAQPGLLVPGTFDGAFELVSGTSIATPIALRAVARAVTPPTVTTAIHAVVRSLGENVKTSGLAVTQRMTGDAFLP